MYQLLTSLYRNDCKIIDISMDNLNKYLPYLKCMLDKNVIEEIQSLFCVDSNGIYSNCLNVVRNLDPLFCSVQDNKIYLNINDEMANLFFNQNVEYIGIKMAEYLKIKEKVKVYYENT